MYGTKFFDWLSALSQPLSAGVKFSAQNLEGYLEGRGLPG